MKVTLRYFASIRELLGINQETFVTQVENLNDLRLELVSRGEPYAQAFGADQVVRIAMNQVVCDGETKIADGAEVAFFPPVTGG
jgi:molybdopterin synthase sulfur carrier subunit